MTAEDWQAVDESALAFADWLADATVSGGCTPDLDYGTPAAPARSEGRRVGNVGSSHGWLEAPTTGSGTTTAPVPADSVYKSPLDTRADDRQPLTDSDLAR